MVDDQPPFQNKTKNAFTKWFKQEPSDRSLIQEQLLENIVLQDRQQVQPQQQQSLQEPQLQQLQQEPSPQSLIQKQLPEEIMLLDQVKIIMVSPAIDKKNLQY